MLQGLQLYLVLWTNVLVYLEPNRRKCISCVHAYKIFAPVEKVALDERIAKNCLVLQDQTITTISKALFGERRQKNHPPTTSLFLYIFFQICYSSSPCLQSYRSNSKAFFSIKKIQVGLRYYFFLSLFFFFFVTLSHFSTENKEALSQRKAKGN